MFRRSLLVGPLLLCSVGAAQAQKAPSADDIVRSLKPTTRGIRPAPAAPMAAPAGPPPALGTAAPGTPAPAPVAVAPPEPDKPPSIDLTVQFQTGSATLTPAAARTLDELGRALTSRTLQAYRFRIEGHTDTVGAPEANKALSDRRAMAVAAYLERRFGVQAARLEPVGMGDTVPLVPTPPQTDEPRNRRVQIVNLGT